MEKYGEFLFEASSDNIKECLEHVTEDDIESCCEYKIFNRGYDYYQKGMVEQLWYNSKANTISAEVIGTKEYDVEIYLDNEELLWDPSGMESSLMSQLEKLKGLENQISEQIGELLRKIMIEVNDAFDEGYLYIDNYYNEDYFESPQFDHFVISYIRQLSFTEKINFLQELDSTLGLMSYSTFEGIPKKYNACFSNEESKKLAELIASQKSNINDSLISELFGIVEEKLSIEEKERILTKLSTIHQDHLISLIELLIAQNRHQQAYGLIENFLSGNPDYVEDKIIELYLDLCITTGSDLNKTAMISINQNPNEKILTKIKILGIADTKPFEDVLRSKNSHDLLSFFEKEKRFKDALDLISDTGEFYDDTIFYFFKRNKKMLADEAEHYFLKRIDANLAYTGDSYYSKIAETIGQIKQINSKLAKELVADIRVNYKRRTKLMGMLRRF